MKIKISNHLIWNLILGISYLILMSLLRLTTSFVFKAPASEIGSNLDAFFLGFRYDLRYVGIIMMLSFFLGLFPKTNAFTNHIGKKWAVGIWMFFSFSLFILYTTDFVHFAYLHQRLNASVLTYLQNLSISTQMMWQSYPVVKIVIGFGLVMYVFYKFISFTYNVVNQRVANTKANFITNIFFFFTIYILYCWQCGIYRWSIPTEME